MDLASIIGLILGFVMLIFGILSNGSAITQFLHLPSALITFGGAFASTLTSHTMQEFINGMKGLSLAFKVPVVNTSEMIQNIIDFIRKGNGKVLWHGLIG